MKTELIVLILGSAPDAVRAANWPKQDSCKVVRINNAWRVRDDWDYSIYPDDFPAEKRPDRIDRAQNLINSSIIAGEHEYADELYAELLPVLTFVMQGIPQFLTYGKTLLAYRLAIEIGSAREPWLQPTDFGLECITRYAAQLGPLPTGA